MEPINYLLCGHNPEVIRTYGYKAMCNARLFGVLIISIMDLITIIDTPKSETILMKRLKSLKSEL